MELHEIISLLKAHRTELDEFGVDSLYVFGSVARGEAGPRSDVDMLVDFNRPIGLIRFVRLQRRLSDLLGTRVDLATRDALREPMRTRILAEAVRAA